MRVRARVTNQAPSTPSRPLTSLGQHEASTTTSGQSYYDYRPQSNSTSPSSSRSTPSPSSASYLHRRSPKPDAFDTSRAHPTFQTPPSGRTHPGCHICHSLSTPSRDGDHYNRYECAALRSPFAPNSSTGGGRRRQDPRQQSNVDSPSLQNWKMSVAAEAYRKKWKSSPSPCHSGRPSPYMARGVEVQRKLESTQHLLETEARHLDDMVRVLASLSEKLDGLVAYSESKEPSDVLPPLKDDASPWERFNALSSRMETSLAVVEAKLKMADKATVGSSNNDDNNNGDEGDKVDGGVDATTSATTTAVHTQPSRAKHTVDSVNPTPHPQDPTVGGPLTDDSRDGVGGPLTDDNRDEFEAIKMETHSSTGVLDTIDDNFGSISSLLDSMVGDDYAAKRLNLRELHLQLDEIAFVLEYEGLLKASPSVDDCRTKMTDVETQFLQELLMEYSGS